MTRTLVCFDLGRVLVRLCDGWAHAWSLAALPGAAPAIDEGSRAEVSAHVHAFELGETTLDEFSAQVAPKLGCPPAYIAKMVDAWILGPTDGAVALLDELRDRGHALACLSNTNARHWDLMKGWQDEAHRIFPRFHHRYGSHELRLRKPDPAIYAEVERGTGYPPQQIFFFDDLADNVRAAEARGWRANLLRSLEDPVAEMRALLRAQGLF